MKEKKKVKRFKRILPFICATLLLLGCCMTVCAEEITVGSETFDYTYTVSQLVDMVASESDENSTINDCGAKYQVVTYGWQSSPLLLNVYLSTEPFYKGTSSSGYDTLYTNDLCADFTFQVKDGVITLLNTHDWSNTSSVRNQKKQILCRDGDLLDCIYYTNNDILNDSDDSVFFQRPRLLVELAVPLMEAVQNQTATILPIAVGCLALLIGSLILVPKLKIFVLK